MAQRLKARMAERGLSLKQAVNEALRAGLARDSRDDPGKFRVEPHACLFKPGIDLDKLNQLADELEAEAGREALDR